MSLYDILPGGQQVKCWWEEMWHVQFGDIVPAIYDEPTYSIALREGGFANVIDGIFNSITENPASDMILDAWGDPFDELTKGTFGEDYYFPKSQA